VVVNSTSPIESHDEPLFVLKYKGYKTMPVTIGLFLLTIFLGLAAFVLPAKNTFALILKPFLGFCFFAFQFLVYRSAAFPGDTSVQRQDSKSVGFR
jgi:hypothetical protein